MIKAGLVAAASFALFACSEQASENNSAADDTLLNISENLMAPLEGANASSANDLSSGNMMGAAGPVSAAEPAARTPEPAPPPRAATKAPAVQRNVTRERPEPRPTPKQEPADPHAGHNMMTMNHQDD